jgi:hypothetical protein
MLTPELAHLPVLSQGILEGEMHSRCPLQGSEEWTGMNAGQESGDRHLNLVYWLIFSCSCSVW